jgi:hypothetical protein
MELKIITEYHNVCQYNKICFGMFTVLDDDDKSITAGSIVTVTVTLKRRNMIDDFDIDKLTGESGEIIEEDEENEDKIKDEVEDNDESKVCSELLN